MLKYWGNRSETPDICSDSTLHLQPNARNLKGGTDTGSAVWALSRGSGWSWISAFFPCHTPQVMLTHCLHRARFQERELCKQSHPSHWKVLTALFYLLCVPLSINWKTVLLHLDLPHSSVINSSTFFFSLLQMRFSSSKSWGWLSHSTLQSRTGTHFYSREGILIPPQSQGIREVQHCFTVSCSAG